MVYKVYALIKGYWVLWVLDLFMLWRNHCSQARACCSVLSFEGPCSTLQVGLGFRVQGSGFRVYGLGLL